MRLMHVNKFCSIVQFNAPIHYHFLISQIRCLESYSSACVAREVVVVDSVVGRGRLQHREMKRKTVVR